MDKIPADKTSEDKIPEDKTPGDDAQELSFLGHLVELRNRILRACIAILVVLVALMPFARRLYAMFADPLMQHLPEGSQMIAIDVASPFLAPFKLTLILAILVSMPVVIYQIWAFIAPGLYRREIRLAKPLLFSATLLFYLGCAFAFYVVFPIMFGFFTRVVPEGVLVMTDISRYLDFILTLFIAFGIAFEVPIATIILVAMGVTSPEALARKRGMVIVGVFAIGMLITPPDVISQTLLALPMWLLFEIGIVLSRFVVNRESEETENQASS